MRAGLDLLGLFGLQVTEAQVEPIGVQNMSPQNMSLWHVDYFELKVLEKQLVQEGPSDPPLSP